MIDLMTHVMICYHVFLSYTSCPLKETIFWDKVRLCTSALICPLLWIFYVWYYFIQEFLVSRQWSAQFLQLLPLVSQLLSRAEFCTIFYLSYNL